MAMAQQREDIDLGMDDEGMEYNQAYPGGQPEPEFSIPGAALYLTVRLEEGARIVALNRVQHLLTARDEKIRQGLITTTAGAGEEDYASAIQCFQKLIKNQGVLSLWQGVHVQIAELLSVQVLDAFDNALTIPLVFNSLMSFIPQGASQNTQVMGYYGAYSVHLLLKSLYAYPFKTVHLNLVCQLPRMCPDGQLDKSHMGLRAFLKQVRAEEEGGLWSLYRGYKMDVFGQLLGIFVKVCVQTLILGGEQEQQPSLFKVYGVDLLCSFLVYPLVVLGNRQRLTVGAGKEHRYKGIADLTRSIINPKAADGTTTGGGSVTKLWTGFTFSTFASALDIGIAVLVNTFMRG